MANLDPTAPSFYTQKTPTVFMPLLDGVCSGFQYGTCKFQDHHKTSDGHMALHICQPCVQIRLNFYGPQLWRWPP